TNLEKKRSLINYLLVKFNCNCCWSDYRFLSFKDYIPYIDKITAMMTGSYTGGGVNFAAMSAKFETPGEMVSATTVADNLMMAMFFLVLFAVPSINFIRNKFQTPHIDEIESRTGDDESETAAASFWERNEMSLKDIALSVASAFVLVTISFKLA